MVISMNPLFISFLASLSTTIGSIIVFFKRNNNILCFSLMFASGVMITVSIFDLIPEAFIKLNSYFNFIPSILLLSIFFCIGIIISSLIDKYVPNNDEIYRVGVINLIAIILHNIPEGIVTYLAGCVDIRLGITLAISIALHNIPEGIAIALPIYYSSNNKLKAIIYTMTAGISEFLGSIIALLFLKNYLTNQFIGLILSIIAGIMIQISFYELIPNALKLKNRRVVVYFILGAIMMLLSIIII